MIFELFDFIKIIQSTINVTGEFSNKRQWLNVYLVKNGQHFDILHRGMLRSFFGRSELMNIEDALLDLALSMTGQTIRCSDGLIYEVPNLTHTKGYRGR